MDPTSRSSMMLAPGASSNTPLRCPAPAARLPRLDENLVPEGASYEILDGQRIACMGEPEHARPHAQLAYVLSSMVGPGYDALVELTTRADTAPPPADLDVNAAQLPSTVQELRPDASILRQGADPSTGDRYVEDLSFEVVNTQQMADLRRKAQRLRARGVRRVFAILVKRAQVVEWSEPSRDFIPIVGEIRDPSLRLPLSVQALLQASAADDAVARALLAKNNPVLARVREEDLRKGLLQGRQEGRAEAEAELRQTILAIGELLGLTITPAQRAQLDAAPFVELQALRQQLTTRRTWPAG